MDTYVSDIIHNSDWYELIIISSTSKASIIFNRGSKYAHYDNLTFEIKDYWYLFHDESVLDWSLTNDSLAITISEEGFRDIVNNIIWKKG